MGTPCGARTRIARAPHGKLQCFPYPTGPVRGPCGTRKGAVRQPYGHVRELTQPELAKLPHGRRIWPYGARTGPLRAPQGLFTGCLQSLNPYVARKLIKYALKLYGPRTGRKNLYGAARGPWVDVWFLFKTAREQPVRGPGVWCDWGITGVLTTCATRPSAIIIIDFVSICEWRDIWYLLRIKHSCAEPGIFLDN